MLIIVVWSTEPTDFVLHRFTGVSSFEDEDGGVGVLGETGRKDEAGGAAAYNYIVVRAGD